MPVIELPPVSPDLELDAFVAPFEAAAARGDELDPADYLPAQDHPRYQAVLLELVRLDLEFAWERGTARRLEHYTGRFPALFKDRAALAQLAHEEQRQRLAAGEEPDPDEYVRRFGMTLEPNPTEVFDHANFWLGANMPGAGDVVPPGFVVRAELGRGAFGRVYLAEQIDLAGRQVAIKVSSRLIGEAQTLARLQHTNIVPIFSAHRVGVYQIVVMPYFGAATLADLLKTIRAHGAMPTTARAILTALSSRDGTSTSPTDGQPAPTAAPALAGLANKDYTRAVLEITAALADGLAHAHARGILHRDLKPANVLITDDGRPMLLDFNLAADERGEGRFTGGTPRYMAPEQLASITDSTMSIDGRADVYSLGLILHELLLGRLPFPDRQGTFQEVVAASSAERQRRPGITHTSPALTALLTKCLAPHRAERYQSAEELRDDLRRHLAHQRLAHVREPLSRERLSKWARRHPRLSSASTMAALAALLLVAVALVAYSTWQQARQAKAREQRDLVSLTRHEVQPLVVDPRAPQAQFDAARRRARRALEPYAAGDDSWPSQRAVRDLPSGDVAALQGAIAELLFYDAEAAGRLAERSDVATTRTHLLHEALRANDRAWKMVPHGQPTRQLVVQRAWLLRLDGQADAASQVLSIHAGKPTAESATLLGAFVDLRERRYRQAAAALEELTRSDQVSFSVWLTLGIARLRLQQFEKANEAFIAAGAIEPKHALPLFYRGVALLSAGHYEAARTEFTRYIARYPNEPDAWLNRAIAELRLGKVINVDADTSRAVELAGPPARAFALREQAWRMAGKDQAADEEYARLLACAPNDAEGFTIRAESRMRRSASNVDAALRDYDAALALDPDHVPALRGKASCLAEHAKQPQQALEVLDHLLGISADNIEDRAGYAVLLARLGRRDAARTNARDCLGAHSNAMVLYQAASALALTATSVDERAEVIEVLRRALRLDPSWAGQMPGDPDLQSVHQEPAFRQLIAAARVLQRSDKK